MSYDWKDRVAREAFLTREWFDEIDARFIDAARHSPRRQPAVRPDHPVRGDRRRKVLEVGCGMGLHTELMVRAGRAR